LHVSEDACFLTKGLPALVYTAYFSREICLIFVFNVSKNKEKAYICGKPTN